MTRIIRQRRRITAVVVVAVWVVIEIRQQLRILLRFVTFDEAHSQVSLSLLEYVGVCSTCSAFLYLSLRKPHIVDFTGNPKCVGRRQCWPTHWRIKSSHFMVHSGQKLLLKRRPFVLIFWKVRHCWIGRLTTHSVMNREGKDGRLLQFMLMLEGSRTSVHISAAVAEEKPSIASVKGNGVTRRFLLREPSTISVQ